MRRINQLFIILVILFSVYTVPGYSQNISASFKHSFSAAPGHFSAPQLTGLTKLMPEPGRWMALVKIKDGKKFLIAAQGEKKEKGLMPNINTTITNQ